MSSYFQISEKANKNYLAKLVEVKNLRKHSNADRLMIFTVDGNNVITGTDVKEGDLMVYFPVECCIERDYLYASNSFREKEYNLDPRALPGFFDYSCRVKAIKLRGEKSEGYCVPAYEIAAYFTLEESDLPPIGTEFDMVAGNTFVKKYIPKHSQTPGKGSNGLKKAHRERSILVDGQFRFHEDTPQLGKNIEKIDPQDLVAITYKLHGTSFVVSKVLCKRKLSFVDKVARFFGARVEETEYKNIYSSRKVVKNDRPSKTQNHFYGEDVWAQVNVDLEDKLQDGMTIYGEAVGYTPSGSKMIQAEYDYGHNPSEFNPMGVYIYRITYTNASGKVFEFSWKQIKDYCDRYGMKHVPQLYYGKASGLFPIDIEHHFQENFFKHLQEQFLEKDCYMCRNKVPAEGITVRVEGDKWEIYKLKSFRFLEKESKDLDKGEVDIETQETVEEEIG